MRGRVRTQRRTNHPTLIRRRRANGAFRREEEKEGNGSTTTASTKTTTTTKTNDKLFEPQSGRILRATTKEVYHRGKECAG